MNSTPSSAHPILDIAGLSVEFDTGAQAVTVVRDLGLHVEQGKTLAIVGESGSGKSVSSLTIMGLIGHIGGRVTAGSLNYRAPGEADARDLRQASEAQMRALRGGHIAMIFQEPMTSLNPLFTIGQQIGEMLTLHRQFNAAQARETTLEWLRKVRLPDAEGMLERYPHQLSGGQRQRVMIAMALCCRPALLIADEPTTALDVTIQAQILELIRELQREMHMAVIFITHDMGVVAEMADDVVVMCRGECVEQGPVAEIFAAPRHPYTRNLLASVPRLGSLTGQDFPLRTPHTIYENDKLIEVGETRIQDTVQAGEPLLQVRDLCTRFTLARDLLGRATHECHAIEHVSFDLRRGETLALVGESGSGKTTLGRTINSMVAHAGGAVHFDGIPVFEADARERRQLRREIQYVFQDPYASLDPRKTVGFSVAEPMRVHGLAHSRSELKRRVGELLERVGIAATHAERYPHQFSGGQRQRICIARALSCDPRLIIADESVSALDVSVQAQVLNLLMDIQQERKVSYLFITHDMAVVEKISHRVAVLYLGQIVELGTRRQVFESARHPYTQRLLASVPVAEVGRHRTVADLARDIPSAVRRRGDPPPRVVLKESAPGHFFAQ